MKQMLQRFRCTHWHSSRVSNHTLCSLFWDPHSSSSLLEWSVSNTLRLGFLRTRKSVPYSSFYSSLCAQDLISDKYCRIEWWKKHEWNNFHLLILQLAWSCTRSYKILDLKRTLVVSQQYRGKAETSCLWCVTPVQHSLHAPASLTVAFASELTWPAVSLLLGMERFWIECNTNI